MKKLLAFLFALLATPATAQTIPSGAWGSINYWGVGGLSQVLAPGLAGQCLTSQNVGSAPIWVNCQVSSLALLPPISANSIMANNTLNFVAPQAIDVNRVLDMVGYDIIRPPVAESIIYKSNVGPNFNWQTLPPGISGALLTSGGPTNPPFWAPTATQANLASICQTVGAVLYFDTPSLLWKCLNPGTSGQLLQTGGATGNPSWLTVTLATLGGVPSTRNVNTSSPLGGGGALSADLTLTCSTCATTTNGGALSATAPVTLSAAGNISMAYTQPVSYPSAITFGHTIPFTDSDAQFGNQWSQYPLGVVSTNPLIIGKSGSTIGSSTVGQTFKIIFTSTGLTGSPITKTYTAIGGDTVSSIATGLCALVQADPVLHGLGGKPIFCQVLSGGTFNLQYDAAFSATGATPLTTTTTGSTGTINLAAEQNNMDFILMQLGRNIAGRTPINGDTMFALDFTGQSSTGLFDTHYAQMTVTATNVTSGGQRGIINLNTASNTGILGRAAVGQGLMVYDAAGAQPSGGDLGPGTINIPATGSYFLGGGTVANSTALYTPGGNLFGGTAAGSTLNLQSTQSGSPSGDFVQVNTGAVVRQKWFSDGGITIGAPTGGDKGANTLNTSGAYYINGNLTSKITTQTFTTGTDATYTTPAGVTAIEIEIQGGGGGGAGSGTAPGAATVGGNTCWNTSGTACTTPVYQATGGGFGITSGATSAGGSVAGSASCNDSMTGGSGGAASGVIPNVGAGGGISRYGGAGVISAVGSAGVAAVANSGSGGSGGGTGGTANSGGGGAAGGWCYAVILVPAATYKYTVGAAGAAGTAGTGGVVGGAGAAGKIRVTERYN